MLRLLFVASCVGVALSAELYCESSGGVRKEYFVSTTTRDYDASRDWCQTQGGVIATVHSHSENERVKALVTTTSYIGALSDGNGNWRWEDGSAWDYTDGSSDLWGTDET